MDFIGVTQLSNILVYKARNDETSNTSTNLQTSLELCENAEAYEILAMNYEDLISSEFICPDIYNNIVYYYEKALELEPSKPLTTHPDRNSHPKTVDLLRKQGARRVKN